MASSRHKNWCFTINNYGSADEERLNGLASIADYIVFGRERGESGTPHLQGFIRFRSPVRFATVRGRVGERAHLEVARGTPDDNRTYCIKEGDFVEHGTCPDLRQGRRSDLDAFYNWSDSFSADNRRPPSTPEVARAHPSVLTRYPRAVSIARLRFEGDALASGEPNAWQSVLEQELDDDPIDDRRIMFYVDPEGGSGKSWFVRYYYSKYRERVQCLSIGKRDDLAHAISPSKSVFLINVPRSQMEFLQYSILEQIKDRLIFSPKYNSSMKEIPHPTHVVVFSNEFPDETKMSEDRIYIRTGPHYLEHQDV